MKKLTAFLLMAFMATPIFAKDIKVTVKGMVCGFCAQGITKKFKAQPEIESIDVSLEKKTVSIKTKNQQDISDQAITQILTESGYNVEKIER